MGPGLVKDDLQAVQIIIGQHLGRKEETQANLGTRCLQLGGAQGFLPWN